MGYKIGFYYHVPYHLRTNANCILVFNGNNLEFRSVRRSLFPSNEYPTIPECCIQEPIVYFENDSGEIIDADFVKDLPLRTYGELTDKGLELYVPFYCFERSSNPCIGKHITTGRDRNSAIDVTIMKDGINLFPIPSFNSFEWRDNTDSHLKPFYQQLFAHYVLCYSFLRRMTLSIYNERLSLSLFSFYLDQPWKSFYLQQIKTLNDYLEGINIESITKELSISISESFYRKIGHDDEYSIIKKSNVKDNSVFKDLYLNHLLQLGDRVTYHDRGYCPAETMALEGIQTGDLKGDELEKERAQIIRNYSKNTHSAFLLSELFATLMHNQYHSSQWVSALRQYHEVLINDYRFGDLHHSLRDVYSFIQSKRREYNNDLPRIVNDLNDKINYCTTCTLTLGTAKKLEMVFLNSFKTPNYNNEFLL